MANPPQPTNFIGSEPEWLVFTTLLELGKKPGIDFVFQSAYQGGRLSKGGLVLDFLFYNPPGLVVNVQGEYYHYLQGTGTIVRDVLTREQLAGEGITLIFIDAEDVIRDRKFYVREALQFKDHSKLSRQ